MPEIDFLPIAGAPPTIEWIPVGTVLIDESYQRSIDSRASQRLISQIAHAWDWRLFNPLSLSRRAGGLYVIDGQHRLAAAKLRGDLPHLPSVVANFDSAADEARAFVAVNTARRVPTTLDRFRARCAGGDKVATDIAALIAEAGLVVGRSINKINEGEIISVRICERTYNHYGRECLGPALKGFASAFAQEGARVVDELMPGLCFAFKRDSSFPAADILKLHTQSDWFHLVAVMRNAALLEGGGCWRKSYDQTLYELFLAEHAKACPPIASPPSIAATRPKSLISDLVEVATPVPPRAWEAAREVAAALGKPSLIRNGEFVIGNERFTPDQIVARAAQLAENIHANSR